MNRVFQVLGYYYERPAAIRSDASVVERVWMDQTVDKAVPTYVLGATAYTAAQPACALYRIHFSDIQVKEVPQGVELPQNGRVIQWGHHDVIMVSVHELKSATANEELTSSDVDGMAKEALCKLQPRKAKKGKR